jgi:hypothetical protein
MLSRQNHHLSHPFTVAAIVFCFAIAGSITLKSQSWTPAGQMVGPLMWEFPLSLPNGTNLIGLRWVNQRNNDSLYWYEINSFSSTPKMYERQTPGFRTILDVNDFDSDGYLDLAGIKVDNSATVLWAAMSEREHSRDPLPDRQSMAYGVSNRYFGDVDRDGLNDDYSAEGESAARIVWGDSTHPFTGPSYVEIFDNSNEIYPTLPPTKVVAVGLLDGTPCIVQSYQLMPDSPPFYELHELNVEDLRARSRKIRTTLQQKINVGESRRYGSVILRTPETWWLFSSFGKDSSPNGLMVTTTSMTLEPVPVFWGRTWQQYYGQGGHRGDDYFPRVMDSDRPFIVEEYKTRQVEGFGEVRHALFTLARLADPTTASVEVIGQAIPPNNQLLGSYAGYLTVVPDVDGDLIEDLMINAAFKQSPQDDEKIVVSLYLTSQRPTVSTTEAAIDSARLVVDQGSSWRIVDGMTCSLEPVKSARIYDVNGAVVAIVTLIVSGADLIVDKPTALSQQPLWLRFGYCTLRLL